MLAGMKLLCGTRGPAPGNLGACAVRPPDRQSRVMGSRNYCSAEAVGVVVAAVAGIHSIERLVIETGSELVGWVVAHGKLQCDKCDKIAFP